MIELIGCGAMGEVYRAEHALLGRPVALKVLRPALVHSEELAERFFAEARAVNVIGHENIVEISDFVHEPDGTTWLVMELLEGQDLAGLLRDGPLPVRRALAIVRQICDALVAVHEAGIVHRDIKPENVFLTDRDGEDFVKLLDFGIAQVPDSDDAPGNSALGHVFGTPPYMAPEQACGDRTDHRCDLYAVGALLFELLTGRMLFQRDSIRGLLAAVAFAEPPVPSECASLPGGGVSREVDKLVARCLAKDPADRPQSAREILEVLDGIERCLADVETDTTMPVVEIEEVSERDESLDMPAGAALAHVGAGKAMRPLRWAAFASCVFAVWAAEPSSWLEQAAASNRPGPSRAAAAALVPSEAAEAGSHESSAVAVGSSLSSASATAASAVGAGACRVHDECARTKGARAERRTKRAATEPAKLRNSKTIETAMIAASGDAESGTWREHSVRSPYTLDPDLLLNPFAGR